MPIDHKRINGPEESVPYDLFVRSKPTKEENRTISNLKHQIVGNVHMKVSETQKSISLETGIINEAKGSAYIEVGQTKVIVSVFDPREIPNKSDYGLKGELYCEFKFAPFSCQKRKMHQQNNEEKQFSHLMQKALESAVCLHELPNFQVDVYALVLEDDGAALSSAITAAGVALTEAGVPMFDLISSFTLVIKENHVMEAGSSFGWQGELIRGEEWDKNDGILVVSKLHSNKQICQFYQSGFIVIDAIKPCLQVISVKCDEIVPIIQTCLVESIKKNILKSA